MWCDQSWHIGSRVEILFLHLYLHKRMLSYIYIMYVYMYTSSYIFNIHAVRSTVCGAVGKNERRHISHLPLCLHDVQIYWAQGKLILLTNLQQCIKGWSSWQISNNYITASLASIQGVSRLYGITAGGDFLGSCDQKFYSNMCPILDGYGVMGVF